MASATSKPEKKLAEFLKEQQEPFILELYLLERSPCSKIWSSTISLEKPATSCFNKNTKPLFSFFKVLTSIHKKKLGFHTAIKDSNTTNTNKHANVGVTVTHEAKNVVDQTDVVETERFSTASSSTMFNSCSDIDDEEENRTSFSSYEHNNPLFSSDTCQASSVSNLRIHSQLHNTNNRKHRKRCIEVCVTHETLNKDVCVCGVLVPKKMTEDSLLSAALWSSLIHTTKRDQNCTNKELKEIFGYDVSHVMKSKRVLHKTKRMLFDYVRELTASFLRKDCKQFMGPEKLGKIIWEKSQRSGNGTNIIHLLNLDYLDSINEWSEFKTQVKDVGVEIADAILDCVMNDVIVL